MITHHPVLLPQVLECLAPRPGAFFVDATVGGAGHAEAILEATSPDGLLVGIDRDPAAVARSGDRLARFGDRVALRCAPASSLAIVLEGQSRDPDGILLDLGTSAFQLEDERRGFSFQKDGPLDMRMDDRQDLTADDVVNRWSEADLAHVVRTWGQEPQARRVARRIVENRPIRSTRHLAQVVEATLGFRRGSHVHPATRTFQAIRIAVNDEIGEVEAAVAAALAVVAPGGRVAVISFHSLEDRVTKTLFNHACGKDAERDPYGRPVRTPGFRSVTRGAIKGEEADPHPRARSARLRVVERLAGNDQGGVRELGSRPGRRSLHAVPDAVD